jgi:hypothetical protein
MSLRKLSLGMAAVGGVIAVAAGCGGSSSSPSTGGADHQAFSRLVMLSATKTQRAGSVHLVMHGTAQVPNSGASVTFTASGGYNLRQRLGEVRIRGGATPSVSLTEVFRGNTIYIHSPKLTAQLPNGKSWAAINLARAAARQGVNLSALQSAEADPTQALSYLTGVSSSVTRLGSQTITGAPTTHYRAVVDLRRIPAHAPPGQRAAAARSIQHLIALTHRPTFPIDVWIDRQDRVRQETVAMPLPSPTGGGAGRLTIRIDLSRFGSPVHVSVPPKAEVAHLPVPTGEPTS